MRANLTTNKIEMSKKEANEAGKIGTKEFLELKQLKEFFPTYIIEIKTATKRKAEYKGLTYDYMKNYIVKCDKENKDKIMEDFKTLTDDENGNIKDGLKIADGTSYLKVKEWFLKTFPEIEKFKEDHENKVKEILNKVA